MTYLSLPTLSTRSALLMASAMFAMLATQSAYAQTATFQDVSPDSWYGNAVNELRDNGALAGINDFFRPSDLATRGELISMFVKLTNMPAYYPAQPSFVDVSRNSPDYPYIEAAANAHWIHGDGNCYGKRGCTVRPNDPLNKAEAVAMLVRLYALPENDKAPEFADNPNEMLWYYEAVQTAGDNCVLVADDSFGTVDPQSTITRGELAVLFDRASKNLEYRQHCSFAEPVADIDSINAISDSAVRIRFNVSIDTDTANEAFRYMVSRDTERIDVLHARKTGLRTVELTLESPLAEEVEYRLNVADLYTSYGYQFSDTETFTYEKNDTVSGPFSVTPIDNTRVRLEFVMPLNTIIAAEASRYKVSGAQGQIGVSDTRVLGSSAVELIFDSRLESEKTYTVKLMDIQAENGTLLEGMQTFTVSDQSAAVSQ